jgi:DNA polymerase III epsilon subunit-like protein
MKRIKPFSENILFCDTEFTSLDPYIGEIISIALIKPDGKELYLEIEYNIDKVSDFVKENVIPRLEGNPISRKEARKKIKKFIGNSKPYLISYVNDYDVIYWNKLFEKKDEKNKEEREKYLIKWISIDFATLLFFNETNLEKFLKKQGIPELEESKQHNALNDARFLRDIYYLFLESVNKEK